MRYCSQDADIRDDVSAATGDYSEAKRRSVHSKIVVHYACVFSLHVMFISLATHMP